MLSICIFGSQARQTADAISDRDVLVVGPPSPDLDKIVADWVAREWNVSVFDRLAFSRMAAVKALFVQHLKQEGRLVRDENGFLRSLLAQYSPKKDYSGERNDALRQIMALPLGSDVYWRNLCLADIIYVLFRNAAILHLACLGEYCFQYDALVDRMANIFDFGQSEQRSLLALRNLKHGYRRRAESLTVEPCLQEARAIIGQMMRRLSNACASSIAVGVTTDDYFKLRLQELELVTQNHPLLLDGLSQGSESFMLWQRIRSSAGYPKSKVSFH